MAAPVSWMFQLSFTMVGKVDASSVVIVCQRFEGTVADFTGDDVTFITFQTNSYQADFIWSLQAKLLVVIFDPKQEQTNVRKQEGIKRLKNREQAENHRGERSSQQCWRAAQTLHTLQKMNVAGLHNAKSKWGNRLQLKNWATGGGASGGGCR